VYIISEKCDDDSQVLTKYEQNSVDRIAKFMAEDEGELVANSENWDTNVKWRRTIATPKSTTNDFNLFDITLLLTLSDSQRYFVKAFVDCSDWT